MADFAAIWRGDRALLAQIADAEQDRQVAHFKASGAPRARIAEVDSQWGHIALWLRGGICLPPDAAATLDRARRAADQARKAWRTDDDPRARHFLGLIAIWRMMEDHWGKRGFAPIEAEAA